MKSSRDNKRTQLSLKSQSDFMKHVLITTALISLLIAGCAKKTAKISSGPDSVPPDSIYTGVVLRVICCQDVIQTIGTYNLGQMGWIDSGDVSHPVYDHVFRVANPCQFGAKQGDTIRFKVIAQEPQNCACCMIYTATPETRIPIRAIN